MTSPASTAPPGAATAAKDSLRARLKQRRAEAAAVNGVAIADLAATRFLAAITVPAGSIVAGYWPQGDELDPRPLLRRLAAGGAAIVLPAVPEAGRVLAFRRWDDIDTPPPPGRFGIPAPPAAAPLLRPGIVLVPLTGFDRAGHRLGMGGGYYDATLAALRGDGGAPPLAVGYAFAVQQVAALPHDGHDQRLDWAVTERGAVCFREGQSA